MRQWGWWGGGLWCGWGEGVVLRQWGRGGWGFSQRSVMANPRTINPVCYVTLLIQKPVAASSLSIFSALNRTFPAASLSFCCATTAVYRRTPHRRTAAPSLPPCRHRLPPPPRLPRRPAPLCSFLPLSSFPQFFRSPPGGATSVGQLATRWSHCVCRIMADLSGTGHSQDTGHLNIR